MRQWLVAILVVIVCSTGLVYPEDDSAVPGSKVPVDRLSKTVKQFKVSFIKPAESKITIDGKLEEPVYKHLVPSGNFWQFHPRNGGRPSFKTYVYAWFDKDNIYFAFRCFDPHPGKITSDITPFGEYSHNDDVRIYIDTFRDKRTFKCFAVNARGIKSGEKTVWDGDARITPEGWCAEFKIPFKSLRFPVKQIQHWSINFRRRIFRLKEVLFWTRFGRDKADVFGDTFGELQGLRDIKGGKNLEVFPYAGYRHSKSGDEKDSKFAVGMDLKYGITSNLTLDMTSSPDYSEVESDPFFYQLSPYEHRFQENRPFYAESSGYFDTPFRLFYSRRITNPTLAAKITGKEKGYSIGLLLAKNRQEGDDAIHGVVRLKKDIFRLSTLGIIYSSIEEKHDWNRNIGVDLNLRFSDYYQIQGMAALSYNKGDPKRHNGMYYLELRRVVDRGLSLMGRFQRVEPNVNVRSGFFSSTDFQQYVLGASYGFRWEDSYLDKLSISASKMAGSTVDSGLKAQDIYQFSLELATKDFLSFSVIYNSGGIRPRILDCSSVELAWDHKYYDSKSISAALSYEGHSRFLMSLSMCLIDDFVYHPSFTSTMEGNANEFSGRINFKINPQLQLGCDYTHKYYYSDDRNHRFKGNLVASTLKWQMSKRLSSFIKFQYDAHLKRYQYDFLIGYEPANVSRIYLSIKNYSERTLRIFDPEARSIAFKISYLVRI